MVKEIARVPIIGNGHCFTLSDAQLWKEHTGVNGIMAARGLLQNPALFAGYSQTPPELVKDWIAIAFELGLSPIKIHQHLMFMLYSVHSPSEKQEFNSLKSSPAILEYFQSFGYNFGNFSRLHLFPV